MADILLRVLPWEWEDIVQNEMNYGHIVLAEADILWSDSISTVQN